MGSCSFSELRTYITQNPNSIIAVNLKACSHYQLYNGKADCGSKVGFRVWVRSRGLPGSCYGIV